MDPRALIRRVPWFALGFTLTLATATLSGCTVPHSKQAMWGVKTPAPQAGAHFVDEEDSGLMLLGVLFINEPDHYAVLLERMKHRYHCARLIHPQLDFYTDHWLLVAFPVARVTALCAPALPKK